MFYIYILLSKNDYKTYIGQTNNLVDRLKRHNKRRVRATKYRTPLILLYSESFKTRSESMQRETWWKSHAGRKKIKRNYDTWIKNA